MDELPLPERLPGLRLRLRPVASTGGALIVSYVLMIAISIATARLLGPAAKGQVAAVASWTQILIWVSTFGLNTAIAVRVAESFRTPAGRDTLRACLGNSAVHSLVVSTLVAIPAMLALTHLLSGLGPGLNVLLLLSLIGLPAGVLSSILLSAQLSLERSSRFTAAQIMGPAAAGLLLLARYSVSGRLTPLDVVGSALASTICVLLIVAKGLPWRASSFHRQFLIEDLRFGGSTAVGGIFSVMNLRLDVLVLSVMVSASDIGLYSAANNVMAPILIVPAAAAAHLTPNVARRAADEDTTGFILREAFLFAGLGAAGGLLLAALAPVLVPLALGEPYRPAVKLVWILVPGFIARGFVSVVVAGALGQRRPRVGNVAELVGIIVTILLLPLTLPRLGVVGAAWVSSASYLLSATTAAIMLSRVHQAKESDQDAGPLQRSSC